jgi:alpha-glucosidase
MIDRGSMLTLGALLLIATPAKAQEQWFTLASPNGANAVVIGADGGGTVTYAVERKGERVIAASPIILDLDSSSLGYGMKVTGVEEANADSRYPIVAGKAATGRDHYRQVTVHFEEQSGARRRMDVVVRAYDDGVAFRTILPVQSATSAAIIRSERTRFDFPASDYRCWGFNVGKFRSSHEGEFDPVDVRTIRDHNLFSLPFVCETGKAAFALAEADLLDFAGMYLTGRGDGGPGLQLKLSPMVGDGGVAVRTRVGSPIVTPWRVVMLADRTGALIESTLLTNLSTPSRIADTSWIKPGLTSWDWWNGPVIARYPGKRTSTEVSKALIDFSADNNLPYGMIDEGWYQGAGGGGVRRPGVDITRWNDAIDLEAVAAYAKSRGVQLWLWTHWEAMDDQMEDAMALYARLGIVGIKVDFMDRDDQWMVNWYTRLLSTAARHKLMVNLHGAYPPRGLTRTYPNFVTQEGVLGAEYNKWSRRVTARHNVMLAYTRGLLGAMDYTPGGFRNVSPAAFRPRNDLPMVQTTRAHGLALYVVYESALGGVADSPDTYAESPAGLEFVRGVPTAWDETRFVAGETGEYVAVARRKGKNWYLGAITDGARTVRLPLDFLGSKRFDMTLWADGDAPDAVAKSQRQVSAGDAIEVKLAATGGAAAVFRER